MLSNLVILRCHFHELSSATSKIEFYFESINRKLVTGQEETDWDSINTARKVVRKSDSMNLLAVHNVSLSIYNTASLT